MVAERSELESALVSPSPQADVSASEVPLRLGVLASGNGSNFEAIARAIAAGQLNARLQVVAYDRPQAPVAQRAQRWGVPAELCRPRRSGDTREAFDRALVARLQAYGVEWVAMAGWMRIVTPTFIAAFPDRAINIHPSLLPSFKGLRAIEQALEAGVTITGCTAHVVRSEVDSGPILMQAAVPVRAGDTPETLRARVQAQEHAILPAAIALASRPASSRLRAGE